MKKRSALLVPALLAATLFAGIPTSLVSAETAQTGKNAVVFNHVNVVDVKTGQLQSDMTVVIQGDRIVEVGKSGTVAQGPNAQVVDATGKFLVPGLWDMHTHILHDKDVFFPLLLANGVTGVRDMGGFLENLIGWQQDAKQGKLMPQVVSGGTIVEHATWAPARILISGEEEARHAVQTLKKHGAEHVKAYERLNHDEFMAIADEAKKQGLPLVGHLTYSVSMADASDAGQKSFEHLEGLYMNTSSKETEMRNKLLTMTPEEAVMAGMFMSEEAAASYDPQKADALYNKLIANGSYQTPTLIIQKISGATLDPDVANDARIKYIPDSIVAMWEQMAAGLKASPDADQIIDVTKKFYSHGLTYVKRMNDAGVPLLAGTDTVISGIPYTYPGFSMHDELAELVQAGLTPAEALRTATINPAKYLGKEQTQGTVEKNKEADLILLGANPLTDINNIRKIESVVVDGNVLDRAALDRLLNGVETLAKQPRVPAMVPVRQVEGAGVKIEWHAQTQSATLRKGNNSLELFVGQPKAIYNGDEITLSEPPSLVENKLMARMDMINALLEIDIQE